MRSLRKLGFSRRLISTRPRRVAGATGPHPTTAGHWLHPLGTTGRLRSRCLHRASIAREGGMGRETARNAERRKPSQDKRSRRLPRSAGGVPSAHNPKVAGSNPAPATKKTLGIPTCAEGFLASRGWSFRGFYRAFYRGQPVEVSGAVCLSNTQSMNIRAGCHQTDVPTVIVWAVTGARVGRAGQSQCLRSGWPERALVR